MSDLAFRIKEAREARDLTQAQVADKVKTLYPGVKLSQQNIAKLESGKHKSTGYIAELAHALDVYTDWLALGKGPRDRDATVVTVADPKLVAALHIMEPMTPYQVDMALKILVTLAHPDDAPKGQ